MSMVQIITPRLSGIVYSLILIVLSFHVGFIYGGELIAAGSNSIPPAILPGLFVSGNHYATAEFLRVYQATETLSYLLLLIAVLAAIPKLKEQAQGETD